MSLENFEKPVRVSNDIETSEEIVVPEVFKTDGRALQDAIDGTENGVGISEMLNKHPKLRKVVGLAALMTVLSGNSKEASADAKEVLDQAAQIAKTIGPEDVVGFVNPVAGTVMEIGKKAIEVAERAEAANQKERFVAAMEEGLKSGGGEVVNELSGSIYKLREANDNEFAEYIEAAELNAEKELEITGQSDTGQSLAMEAAEPVEYTPEMIAQMSPLEKKELLYDPVAHKVSDGTRRGVIEYGPTVVSAALSKNPITAVVEKAANVVSDKIHFLTPEQEKSYSKYMEATSASGLLEKEGKYFVLEVTGSLPEPEKHELNMGLNDSFLDQ